MLAALRIDELDVDPQPTAAALNTSFQHIPHVKVATDLSEVDSLALVGEGSIARDDKRVRKP